jgi:hypothetical protein
MGVNVLIKRFQFGEQLAQAPSTSGVRTFGARNTVELPMTPAAMTQVCTSEPAANGSVSDAAGSWAAGFGGDYAADRRADACFCLTKRMVGRIFAPIYGARDSK